MHIQNFGCQSHLRHQVISATPSIGKIGDESNNNGVRLVFSFRYSIDNRDVDLLSALINDDEKLRGGVGRRGDYTISHVIDALEKGCKPTPAIDPPVGRDTGYASCPVQPHSPVDPSRLLVDGGIGLDKPNRLVSDAIQADQQSIRETTSGDTFDYKDVHELWQRVSSGPFLRCLNRNKIRVRNEHRVSYKNQDGGVEWKKATALFGQAPKLFVQVGYGEGKMEEREKRLTIGDVLSELTVRDHYGVPRNEHTSPPWSCVHDGLMHCIIIAQDYKNDYEGIRAIQDKIASRTFSPKLKERLFWIGGSGGAPEDYGRKPVKLSSVAMEEKTARYTLPHNQSRSSSMNKALLNLGSRRGTIALFAHPVDDKSPTGRDEVNLQFLGHYSALKTHIGNDWSDDKILRYVRNLPGKKGRVRGV
jgi:hypothetical protein